jgi:hypothetical protein
MRSAVLHMLIKQKVLADETSSASIARERANQCFP